MIYNGLIKQWEEGLHSNKTILFCTENYMLVQSSDIILGDNLGILIRGAIAIGTTYRYSKLSCNSSLQY